MTIVLRPDQAQLKADIYRDWNQGARNVLAVLPTGGGKSIVTSDIVLDGHNAGEAECVMAHRTELVGQMSLHVARRGIPHRLIAPAKVIREVTQEHRREFGRSFINPDARCAVGAVDTIIARVDSLRQWAAQIDRWTVDEAHHVLRANKWGKCVELFSNARGLGVTATPSRADGAGLGSHADGVFDTMCRGPSMRWLIDNGALSEYEIVLPESDYHISDEALTATGDFSQKKMKEESRRSRIVGDVVSNYSRYAFGKRAICFATDVETAGKIAQQFMDCGIPAAAVSAETPSEVRAEFIRRFRDGRIWVLVNVDLFGEGFDVPACEVVIMARPTASLGLYLQMAGRALRVLAGKLYGLIIDHVSNVIRHGLPDKQHYWTLDRREKRGKKEPDPEEIPLTTCRGCSRPYERFHPACPYCGWTPPLPDPGARTLQQVDGDLVLLDRDRLAALRASIELESPASVGQRVEHAAGGIAGARAVNMQIERHQAQKRLTVALNQWAGIGRHKGRTDREMHKRFYLATGMDVLSVLAMPRAEMEKMSDTVEGWCR